MLCVVEEVWGVTQLDNVVYAVFLKSSIIKKYTADALSPLDDIHVEGMRDPNDIVVCRDDRQLYVADWHYCIWRVSLPADHHSCVKWLPTDSTTDDTFRVKTLSVTSQRLLVTLVDPPRLHQYNTTNRQLLLVVPMPGDVVKLWHGIETTSGKFVVCHRGTEHDKQQCAVSDPF